MNRISIRWLYHLVIWTILVTMMVCVDAITIKEDAGIYEEIIGLGIGLSVAFECFRYESMRMATWLWIGWLVYGLGNLFDVLDELVSSEKFKILYLDTSLTIMGMVLISYGFLKQTVAGEKMIARLSGEVAANKSLRAKLYKDARLDELTQLGNRRACFERFSKLGLITHHLYYFDLDKFKQCNDTHGHRVGDKVLEIFGRNLSSTFGSQAAFRVGGDEFVALSKKEHDLGELAASLCAGIADYGVDVSIGSVEVKDDANIDELLNRADGEMYKAKFRRQSRAC
ncbi:putative diguanylate cyclase YdaM [Grimontia celer]|uniref:diguanylate cyclase n=1 Tax=Grimontia celer TaxID=1796497 RepID=A0A128EZB2_9GAMM|nr:GGDEF domain-containing protein [Grimontia celer]CZF79847.1 putative diguanylate cyclase YdaM [Grimontia celer]